jgi:hypothetical protein
MKRTKQIWIIGTIVLALAVMGPLHAQGVFMIKSGSLTATSGSCTATACVSMPVNSATGSVGVQIAGSFSATVSFEGTGAAGSRRDAGELGYDYRDLANDHDPIHHGGARAGVGVRQWAGGGDAE